MLSLRFLNPQEPTIVNFLRQIAEAVFELGRDLLRTIADFEIFIELALRQQKLSAVGCVFDYVYPQSAMRVTLALNQLLQPVFSVTDLRGITATVNARNTLKVGCINMITIVAGLQQDLTTRLTIIMDGKEVGGIVAAHALEFRNQILAFEKFYNATALTKENSAGLKFGISGLAIFDRQLVDQF